MTGSSAVAVRSRGKTGVKAAVELQRCNTIGARKLRTAIC